jgi:hypothetical protein
LAVRAAGGDVVGSVHGVVDCGFPAAVRELLSDCGLETLLGDTANLLALLLPTATFSLPDRHCLFPAENYVFGKSMRISRKRTRCLAKHAYFPKRTSFYEGDKFFSGSQRCGSF